MLEINQCKGKMAQCSREKAVLVMALQFMEMGYGKNSGFSCNLIGMLKV